MNKLKNSLYATAGFIVLAMILTLSGTGRAIAEAISQVKVVNTLREPVPTTVQGTAQVSISNSPTVQVGNADGDHIPVKMTTPARVPFQASANGVFGAGSVAASGLIAVPAGKRLFIEYTSAFVVLPTGQNLHQISIATTVAGGTVQHQLTRSFSGPHFSGTDDVFTSAQETRLYADGGSAVVFSAARNSTVGQGTLTVTVSGYLEDLP
jgi:hypothetical protein